VTRVQVIGAGAFGTALAVVLARAGKAVTLVGRDPGLATRRQSARLPGVQLPDGVTVADGPDAEAGLTLIALPMQVQAIWLTTHGRLLRRGPVISCAKGIDLATARGAVAVIADAVPGAKVGLLTGPGFAADIAAGLPTAMTLACIDAWGAEAMQMMMATPTLRIYRTTDVVGAELGGALKNVVAIAAGVVIGAGLGESARAALMTRGYAEMVRAAQAMGAKPETLAGLSGLGDLVLTCTSDQSRNFRYGRTLASGQSFDPAITVEGVATAHAMETLAARHNLDLPITTMVAALTTGKVTLDHAIQSLLSRPLKQE
jgi:glycerol-3-phosphate dehydrogenase (NAD(P)+)